MAKAYRHVLNRSSNARMDTNDRTRASPTPEFPIFSGGPFYRLEQRIPHTHPEAPRPRLAPLYAMLVAWVPMALLSVLDGLAIGPTRLQSFMADFEVNVRFLITVPAFLFAENLCGHRLRAVMAQFRNAGLVVEATRARFDDLMQETVRLSHSGRVEALLLGLAYLHSAFAFGYALEMPDPTWRLPMHDGQHMLSFAGAWYFLVAFPLYSFLLLRWLWRIALWWRLLGRVSKLEMNLSPAHRDGAGGLGFLSESLLAFAGFAFATTATAAGVMADFIVYEGESLQQYEWEVGGLLVFLLISIAGPLLLFIPRLYEAKDSAVFRYGAFASRQIQQVDRTWLPGDPSEEGVGINFRAVSHLGSSLTVVRQMSIIPLYKDDVLQLLGVALLPFLPLATTLLPMEEILGLVMKVLV